MCEPFLGRRCCYRSTERWIPHKQLGSSLHATMVFAMDCEVEEVPMPRSLSQPSSPLGSSIAGNPLTALFATDEE
jgi:hypothetical protein